MGTKLYPSPSQGINEYFDSNNWVLPLLLYLASNAATNVMEIANKTEKIRSIFQVRLSAVQNEFVFCNEKG